jgi:prevent-host-death family protein
MKTGIRELKDNLSRYIRRIEAGERISVTAHGRVVAELVPPGGRAARRPVPDGTSSWQAGFSILQ